MERSGLPFPSCSARSSGGHSPGSCGPSSSRCVKRSSWRRRAAGARDRRIIFRHILPNAMSPIIVTTTLTIGTAIILEAALSFLGFGVRPPTPAWGEMASTGGREAVGGAGAWWLVMFPSIALISTVLAVNFLGDGLRDALDPTQSIDRK